MHDFVKICKRESNLKRNYLVLNMLQCKHFPSNPTIALSQFRELAEKVCHKYDGKILVIGFAETATAIGVEFARYLNEKSGWLDVSYIQTTREDSIKEYYEFSEEHSHATEQKLSLEDFSDYDRIIFVEDEVTTGNTILNIINVLLKHYPNMKFSVASILNGMSEEQLKGYKVRGIDVYYLKRIDNSSFSNIADSITENGFELTITPKFDSDISTTKVCLNLDTRHITDISTYNKNLEVLKCMIDEEVSSISLNGSRICVLGTEEFMYPAIAIGDYLTKKGYNVVSHSTTRSPIVVNNNSCYPLNTRVSLPSVYDKDRNTFIYNLNRYDLVLVLTENITDEQGLSSLVSILGVVGNKNIKIFKIGE